MNQEQYHFAFDVYASMDELHADDKALLQKAYEASSISYAPYSHFHVGAVAKLANGAILSGGNQENASYPVGICAERVLLSAASAVHPGVPIETIAISYFNEAGKSDRPISPCGICRQTLVEYERLLKHPIRLILGGKEGKIYVIPRASLLLPFEFTGEDLK